MNRRDFLKGSLAAGIGLGVAALPWPLRRGWRALAGGGRPGLVTVRNGEPGALFDRGIAALGGLARFVRPGDAVALRPNISWDAAPEYACTTHPALVGHVARRCLDAGAAWVTVFDHSLECWRQCWERTGIARAATAAGGVMAPAEARRHYRRTAVRGEVIRAALVHRALLDADVVIALPILKHHAATGITAGVKSVMGGVWDRRVLHDRGLDSALADLLALRRPDLTVIDAYRLVAANGPRCRSLADVRLAKTQILSCDAVAADAAAARLLGRRPGDIGHLAVAHRRGLGEIDPDRLGARIITL